MLEKIASSILSAYLGAYISNLNPESLQVSLLRGSVSLSHLLVKKDACTSFNVPYEVAHGTVGAVNMTLPWKNLQSQPVIIDISDVFVVLRPIDIDKIDRESLEKAEFEAKKSQLAMLSNGNAQEQGFFAKLSETVLANLKVSIRNVHIRIEQGGRLALGVCMERIDLQSADETWMSSFIANVGSVVRKIGTMKALSMYCESTNRGSCASDSAMRELLRDMTDGSYDESSVLLRPVNGELKLLQDRVGSGGLTLYPTFEEWNFTMSVSQYQSILSFLDFFARRSRLMKNWKNRPPIGVKGNAKVWWKYAISSVRKLLRERHGYFSWEDIRTAVLGKRRYLVLYKRSQTRSFHKPLVVEEQKELDHWERVLPLEFLIQLRHLADAELRLQDEKFSVQEQERKKNSSWFSGWRAKPQATDAEGMGLKVTKSGVDLDEQELKDLYKDIGFSENDIMTALQSRRLEMHLSLSKVSLLLVTEDYSSQNFSLSFTDFFLFNSPEKLDTRLRDFALGGIPRGSTGATCTKYISSADRKVAVQLEYRRPTKDVPIPDLVANVAKMCFVFEQQPYQQLLSCLVPPSHLDITFLQVGMDNAMDSVAKSFESSEKMTMAVHLDAPSITVPVQLKPGGSRSTATDQKVTLDFGAVDIRSFDTQSPKYDGYDVRLTGLTLVVGSSTVFGPVEALAKVKSLLKPKIYASDVVNFVDLSFKTLTARVSPDDVAPLSCASSALLAFFAAPTGEFAYEGVRCVCYGMFRGQNVLLRLSGSKIVVAETEVSSPLAIIYVDGYEISRFAERLELVSNGQTTVLTFPNEAIAEEWKSAIVDLQSSPLRAQPVQRSHVPAFSRTVANMSLSCSQFRLHLVDGARDLMRLETSSMSSQIIVDSRDPVDVLFKMTDLRLLQGVVPTTEQYEYILSGTALPDSTSDDSLLSVSMKGPLTNVALSSVSLIVEPESLDVLLCHALAMFADWKLQSSLCDVFYARSTDTTVAQDAKYAFGFKRMRMTALFDMSPLFSLQTEHFELNVSPRPDTIAASGRLEDITATYHRRVTVNDSLEEENVKLFKSRHVGVPITTFEYTSCAGLSEQRLSCKFSDIDMTYPQVALNQIVEYISLPLFLRFSQVKPETSLLASAEINPFSALKMSFVFEKCAVNMLFATFATVDDFAITVWSERCMLSEGRNGWKQCCEFESHTLRLHVSGVEILPCSPVSMRLEQLSPVVEFANHFTVDATADLQFRIQPTSYYLFMKCLLYNILKEHPRLRKSSGEGLSKPQASLFVFNAPDAQVFLDRDDGTHVGRLELVDLAVKQVVIPESSSEWVVTVSSVRIVDASSDFSYFYLSQAQDWQNAQVPNEPPFRLRYSSYPSSSRSSIGLNCSRVRMIAVPSVWASFWQYCNSLIAITPYVASETRPTQAASTAVQVSLDNSQISFPSAVVDAKHRLSIDGNIGFSRNSDAKSDNSSVTLQGATIFLEDCIPDSPPIATYILDRCDISLPCAGERNAGAASSASSASAKTVRWKYDVRCTASPLRCRLSMLDLDVCRTIVDFLASDWRTASALLASGAAVPQSSSSSFAVHCDCLSGVVDVVDDTRGFDVPFCRASVDALSVSYSDRVAADGSLSLQCFTLKDMHWQPVLEPAAFDLVRNDDQSWHLSLGQCTQVNISAVILESLRNTFEHHASRSEIVREECILHRSQYCPFVCENLLGSPIDLLDNRQCTTVPAGVRVPFSLPPIDGGLLTGHMPSALVTETIDIRCRETGQMLLPNVQIASCGTFVYKPSIAVTIAIDADGSRLITVHVPLAIQNDMTVPLHLVSATQAGEEMTLCEIPPSSLFYIPASAMNGFRVVPVLPRYLDAKATAVSQRYDENAFFQRFIHLKTFQRQGSEDRDTVYLLVQNDGESLHGGIRRIVVSPCFFVENALPVDATITVFGDATSDDVLTAFHIKSGQTLPIQSVNPKTDVFISCVPLGNFVQSERTRVHISLTSDYAMNVLVDQRIAVVDQNNVRLHLDVDTRLDVGVRRVTIFAQNLISNNTGLALEVIGLLKDGSGWLPLPGCVPQHAAPSFSPFSPLLDVPLMMSLKSLRNDRVGVRLQGSLVSAPFDPMQVGVRALLSCNGSDVNNKVELCYSIDQGEGVFWRSVCVSIRSRYVVRNDSQRSVTLLQAVDARNRQLLGTAKAGESIPLLLLTSLHPAVAFEVVEEDGRKSSSPAILVNEAFDGYIAVGSAFRPRMTVDFDPDSSQVMITIHSSPAIAPFQIVNEFAVPIQVVDATDPQRACVVPSFGRLELPNGVIYGASKNVFFVVDGLKTPIVPLLDITKREFKLSPTSTVFLRCEFQETSKLVVLSSQASTPRHPAAITKQQLVIDIPSLYVSLIDRVPREVLLLSVLQSHVKLAQNGDERSLELKFQTVQIDNQLPGAIFPVLAYHEVAMKERKSVKPMFHLSIVQDSNCPPSVTVLPYVSFALQEMNVELDSAIAESLTDFVEAVHPIPTISEDEIRKTWKAGYLTSMKQSDADGQFMSVSLMQLNSVSLNVSYVQNMQAGLDKSNSKLLKYFSLFKILTNISNAPIHFNTFAAENMFERRQRLMDTLAKNYLQQAKYQLFSVIGNVDLLGNPVNLVKGLGTGVVDFFVEPAQGIVRSPSEFAEGLAYGTHSLLTKTLESTMNTAQKVTGTVGKAITAASFDKDYVRSVEDTHRQKARHVGEGLEQGGKAFAKGLFGGIVGLVSKPVEGAKKDGVAGFFKGVGQGLAGVATKPVSGALTLVAKTTEGVKNTAKHVEGRHVDRVRPPRYLQPGQPITRYDQALSLASCELVASADESLKRASLQDAKLVKANRVFMITSDDIMLVSPKSHDWKFRIPRSELRSIELQREQKKIIVRRELTHASATNTGLFELRRPLVVEIEYDDEGTAREICLALSAICRR